MEVDGYSSENPKKRKREALDEENMISVGIIFDENLFKECDKNPRIKDRTFAVYNLIKAYDLLRNLTILKCESATFEDLCNFHCREYIKYLQEINYHYTPEDEVELEFGLGYDCPPLDGIYDYCSAIAGSTLTAAKALCQGTVDIVINWCGGWHHAQRDDAEGFCYINDIALGILELRKVFTNILYFDLDIHHGNGVENCFSYTKRVMTVSIHLFEPGFYPGSGSVNDVGYGYGSYYSVNVPLQSGTSDSTYIDMFDWLLPLLLDKFTPDAIVIQCGADGLSGDPVGQGFNLSPKAYEHCIKELLKLKKPTLILGGGGYNIANTARCWTYLTSVVTGSILQSDIPENDNFCIYGPSFDISVPVSNRRDTNTTEYICKLKEQISSNLDNI